MRGEIVVSSEQRHDMWVVWLGYHTITSIKVQSYADVIMWKYSRETVWGSNDFHFLFSRISKHDLQAVSQKQKRHASWLWVGVRDAEGLWVIHKSIWNAWPGFSTPHPEAPSVGPMGQLLASLTLLQPKLLRHDAAAIILPPAGSARQPQLPSALFWASTSLLVCLQARIPSLETPPWTDIS